MIVLLTFQPNNSLQKSEERKDKEKDNNNHQDTKRRITIDRKRVRLIVFS